MFIHLDLVGGLAGDMFLAAAIDAGIVDVPDLEATLRTLGLGKEIRVVVERVVRGAIEATHVRFEGWDPDAEADHRHLTEIEAMIGDSGLDLMQRQLALRLFGTLAEAESAIHGIELAKVHFHEVGAVDSLLDFVSAAVVISQNADALWSCGPIPMGRGTIETAHGTIPVPAPATAKMLTGFEMVSRDVEAELVTPTGAAIIASMVNTERRPQGVLRHSGFGAGTRDLAGVSNVARLMVFEPTGAGLARDQVVRLSTDVDDMSPEVIGWLTQTRLYTMGALDVTAEPVHMKKGRIGTRITVLAAPASERGIVDCLMRETSTFGVRVETLQRWVLERTIEAVETDYGRVSVKIGWRDGEIVKIVPEYEDCLAAAERHGVPLQRVFESARALTLTAGYTKN